MTEIDERVVELARTALSLEYGEEHFYRNAAEMTQNEKGKAMFLRLADEEPMRTEDMHKLFTAVFGNEEWQRLVAEEAANRHPSGIVAEMEATLAHRGMIAVADDTQALRTAMELERRVIQVLRDVSEHTEDAAVLELIRKMILEEDSQYDALQARLDSLLNVGLWLDTPEFRMDGKY